MTVFLTSGHPGTLLARISIFETVASFKMQVASRRNGYPLSVHRSPSRASRPMKLFG
ncbi:hypothetical protein V512_009020 [Mesotoga sp. Brook.08.105.5.1]|nr:hypothetical protein V512_009020 [Mesotoga sp. Brook.08.105.5.1]RAO96076.1 hypothetical protein M388_03190 [Mesotoga sp. Brook.08.YT.4.2.5.4.]